MIETSKKIVLCIGDSLALPGHGNTAQDTWFFQLQAQLSQHFVFFSNFRRAVTTDLLSNEGGGSDGFPKGSDTLEFFKPTIIVIQLGVVDCAPRYIRNKGTLKKLIELLPRKLQTASYRVIKKLTTRKISRADVSPKAFENNINNYLSRCDEQQVEQVIFISIGTPDVSVQKKSPGLLDAVEKYNRIINNVANNYKFAQVIDPLCDGDPELYDDGYHPNPKGNKLVADTVFAAIKKY